MSFLSVFLASLLPLTFASPSLRLFSPQTSSLSLSVPVSPPQLNQILAHNLDTQEFYEFDIQGNDREWLGLLGLDEGGEMEWGGVNGRSKLVIVDYGEDEDVYLPPLLSYLPSHSLTSLPLSQLSFDALIATHLSQVAQSQGSRTTIKGFESFAKKIEEALEKEVAWIGVGEDWRGRVQVVEKDPLEEVTNGRLLNGFSFSDESVSQALHEISQISSFVDEIPSNAHVIFALRFEGLNDVAKTFGKNSEEYQTIRKVMAASLEALTTRFSPSTIIHLHLPSSSFSSYSQEHTHSLLSPFHPIISTKHTISKRAPEGQENATRPLVPSHQTCFVDYQECMTDTDDCSGGRGECIEGVKSTLSGPEECWVCSCGKTTTGEGNKVKTTWWSGETCEKKDISSDFFLLFFTSVFLLALVGVSIVVLSSVGSNPLPNQLASMTGGHPKRD